MILHLCVNYGDSRFYGSIFSRLNLYHENTVVAPLRNKTQEDNTKLWYTKDYTLITDQKFNLWHRFIQSKKTKIYADYVTANSNQLIKCKLIHAHSLFSDGSVALLLKQRFGKKYVITVRNTDINVFWRYFLWRRSLGRKIVDGAEKIFVPSESYRQKIAKLFGHMHGKVVLIPNGISNEFFEKECVYKKFERRLLFVGEFSKNKNVLNLIDIVS